LSQWFNEPTLASMAKRLHLSSAYILQVPAYFKRPPIEGVPTPSSLARSCGLLSSLPSPPPFHGGRDFEALAIFGDRAPRDVDIDGFSRATIASSERICAGLSWSINCLIRKRTDSAEWASPPSCAAIEAVKKYLSSKRPRGVAIYLLEVTRETVDSCTPTASAIVLRSSGRKYSTPRAKKLSCWRTISLETFRIVRALCSRLLVNQFAIACKPR